MIATNTNIFAPVTAPFKAPTPKNVFARVLAWVVAKDQAYRAERHMETLTDEALKDVGLSR